jgi:hypothetical protein
MPQRNSRTVVAKNERTPSWATSNKITQYVPELQELLTPSNTVANLLSRLAIEGKVERRTFTGKHYGRGRIPSYEYRVTSVRKCVRALKAERR